MREGTVLRTGCDARSNGAKLAPARILPAGPASLAETPVPPGRDFPKRKGIVRSNSPSPQNGCFPKPRREARAASAPGGIRSNSEILLDIVWFLLYPSSKGGERYAIR